MRLFRDRRSARSLSGHAPRHRLVLPVDPPVIYAVGDVHGCLSDLLALEDAIVRDGEKRRGPKAIIMLGDYVDRGPDSARVLDHLTRRSPPGFFRICLAGNHDVCFSGLLEDSMRPEAWLDFAGPNTLLSYGCDLREYALGVRLDAPRLRDELRVLVPEAHRRFLRYLLASVSTPRYYFVHAGVRPGVELDRQAEEDLFWIRDEFMGTDAPFERVIVHGHSVVERPSATGSRVSIDTGAFLGHGLTAARITESGISFLSSRQVSLERRFRPLQT